MTASEKPASARVTEAMTRQVADLAHLQLSEAEVALFTRQLGEILRYVETLQRVDVSGISPMVHPFDLEAPLREDRALPSPRNERGKPRVLDSAPDTLSDSYRVPPIL